MVNNRLDLVRHPLVSGILLFLCSLCHASEAPLVNRAVWDLGVLPQGGTFPTTISAENVSCRGKHTLSISIADAPWLTIAGPRRLERVPMGGSKTTNALIDLRNLQPGAYEGRVEIRCTSCPPPPRCKQNLFELEVRLVVVASGEGAAPDRSEDAPSTGFQALAKGCGYPQVVNTYTVATCQLDLNGDRVLEKYENCTCSDIIMYCPTYTKGWMRCSKGGIVGGRPSGAGTGRNVGEVEPRFRFSPSEPLNFSTPDALPASENQLTAVPATSVTAPFHLAGARSLRCNKGVASYHDEEGKAMKTYGSCEGVWLIELNTEAQE